MAIEEAKLAKLPLKTLMRRLEEGVAAAIALLNRIFFQTYGLSKWLTGLEIITNVHGVWIREKLEDETCHEGSALRHVHQVVTRHHTHGRRN